MDVRSGLKDIRRAAAAALLLASGCALLAQAPASAAPISPLPPAPPAVTKFFPLSQIHRGQQGVAYTVFEGTRPEPMGVEILGVLHNAIGPRQDMILARLEGAKPDYTGVVAGMSGSPVYIDGRLVGALSYRIGMFSKEPIAGITPIEQMLGVEHQTSAPGEEVAQAGLEPAALSDQSPTAVSAPGASQPLIQPMDTPLTFSGFSPAALQLWKKYAPAGLMPVEGIGGSAGDDVQQGPLIPGSAVSAVLVRGDLDI
ncbi:MAG: SpoIVB peptidase S55 domain-containing protein, partial [Acidobacteriaceae bacterium]